jgi:ketosteroid isomerase-like protein
MSKENVETLRQGFEEAASAGSGADAVDALDPDSITAVLEMLDPRVEFHEDPSFPETGVYRGIEAVRGYWEGFVRDTFDEFSFEAEDFVDVDEDRVLFLFRLNSRGKGSGARVETHPGWIYTFRGGLAVRIEAFLDRGAALEAAGLSE